MSVLFFKLLYPDSIIHAFEPNPATFALLERNIAANEISGVTLHNVGLWEAAGVLSFYPDEEASVKSSLLADRGGDRTINVNTVLLSEHLKKLGRVDLVKIDVEGAEMAIVSDLIKAGVLDRVDVYIIEYHHQISRRQESFSTFLAVFEERGYRYNLSASPIRGGDFQDILVCFYKHPEEQVNTEGLFARRQLDLPVCRESPRPNLEKVSDSA